MRDSTSGSSLLARAAAGLALLGAAFTTLKEPVGIVDAIPLAVTWLFVGWASLLCPVLGFLNRGRGPWTVPALHVETPLRHQRRRLALAIVALAILGAMSVHPLRWLLVPAAIRCLKRPRPGRELRTLRDALALSVAEVLSGGGEEAVLGMILVVLGGAVALPAILHGRGAAVLRRLGAPVGYADTMPSSWWTAPVTAVIALTLFLALPRPGLGNGLEPDNSRPSTNRSGSDSVDPPSGSATAVPMRQVNIGDIGRLQASVRPLLEAEFLRGGRLAPAEDFGPLLRSGPLDTFDGLSWTAPGDRGVLLQDASDGAEDGRVDLPVRDLPLPPEGEALETRLHLLVGGTDSLFCPGLPTSVDLPSESDSIMLLSRGDVRSGDSYVDGTRWTLRSVVGYGAYPLLDGSPPPEQRRIHLLHVPPGHEKTIAMARSRLRGMRPTRRMLSAVERLLADRCRYSLDIAPTEGDTPVEAFLFRSRRGHCELFASSATVMLRAVGVPARLAVGFRGGVLDPKTLRYTFRGADAHAWVEAYLPGTGWVTFDPTPAAGGEPSPLSAETDGEESLAGTTGRGWLRRLLDYDGAARSALMGSLQESAQSLLRRAAETLRRSPRLALLLILLGIAWLAARRIHPSRETPFAGDGALAATPRPVPVAWERLARTLALAGIRRTGAETPSEFAVRAVHGGASPPESVHTVAKAYVQERWGHRAPDDDERRRLEQLAATVEVRPGPAPRRR